MGLKRWIVGGILIGFVGYVAYGAYDFYRGGFFSLPDLPYGAYPISFANGFRAIVIDPDGVDPLMDDAMKYFRRLSFANRERRYLGFPIEVQPWFKDAWSWCTLPTATEMAVIESMPEDFRRRVENARFDAVCKIEIDGKSVDRGWIFSVPRL